MNELDFPSFCDQVGALGGTSGFWPAPSSPDSHYFNSGVCRAWHGLVVARRSTQIKSGSVTRGWRQNASHVDLFELDHSTMELRRRLSLNERLGDFFVNMEDPRLVATEEGFEVWCANWKVETGRTIIRQCVVSLGPSFEVRSIDFPVFGGNDGSLYEKNWGPFDQGRFFVYSSDPNHVVVNRKTGESWVTPGLLISRPDTMHGGTPPLDLGDRYLCISQSSAASEIYTIGGLSVGARWYRVWAYTFEKEPPFRILECSRQPILVGSLRNPCQEGSPASVFPGGLLQLRPDELLLVAGINDCKTGWATLPVSQVLNFLEPFSGWEPNGYASLV